MSTRSNINVVAKKIVSLATIIAVVAIVASLGLPQAQAAFVETFESGFTDTFELRTQSPWTTACPDLFPNCDVNPGSTINNLNLRTIDGNGRSGGTGFAGWGASKTTSGGVSGASRVHSESTGAGRTVTLTTDFFASGPANEEIKLAFFDASANSNYVITSFHAGTGTNLSVQFLSSGAADSLSSNGDIDISGTPYALTLDRWHRAAFSYTNNGSIGNVSLELMDYVTGETMTHTANNVAHSGNATMTSAQIYTSYNPSGADPATFDNVSVVSGPVSPATDFTWVADDVGNWANSGSWSYFGPATQGVANNPNHTVLFADAISTNTTAVTNAHVTVNRIEFANTSNTYNIAGVGSVNFAATTTPQPVNPTMDVAGNHQFQAPVRFHTDAEVNVASASTLIFVGALNLMGHTITKAGAGTMSIRSDFVTGGGTLNVAEGTVTGNGTVGGDLSNAGGIIAPGNGGAAVSGQVPEPGSLVLLVVGGLLMVWSWGRRN